MSKNFYAKEQGQQGGKKAPEHGEHLADQGLAIVSLGALHLQIIDLASYNLQLVRDTMYILHVYYTCKRFKEQV